ncbi:MAG: apolipoprotein N-acyltransferase [Campylobacterota bacterium]|nr:apolipoprotein N-acyltransferase [Campylobacterota bacterium]
MLELLLKNNPNRYIFLYGIFSAILFSAFIYLEEFGVTSKPLNTILALASLALLLYAPKKSILVAGFTIGILWFYWIGYSFEYNGVGFMTPIITFGFGIIYMLFFGVLALTKKIYIRAILLFLLSFFEPFDFNWMQIELLFVDSYIGIFKYQLILVLIALSLPHYVKKPFKFFPLLLILFAFNFNETISNDAPLKIKLVSTDIKQEDKWEASQLTPTIKLINSKIQNAIDEKYDLVILPESVFPMYMNKSPLLKEQLLLASYKIAIVAGSLLYENHQSYNVTYLFQDGEYKVAKKLVLVPFGEYIPLPKFAQKIINDTFFAGAADFKTAHKPTDFMIKGVKFRNAICYEATCAEIYDGNVDFVIAISNNAWFTPSIEPTLQKLLLRFYARKYSVTIYHSANYRGTGIIR